jgi:hypothetical protein
MPLPLPHRSLVPPLFVFVFFFFGILPSQSFTTKPT